MEPPKVQQLECLEQPVEPPKVQQLECLEQPVQPHKVQQLECLEQPVQPHKVQQLECWREEHMEVPVWIFTLVLGVSFGWWLSEKFKGIENKKKEMIEVKEIIEVPEEIFHGAHSDSFHLEHCKRLSSSTKVLRKRKCTLCFKKP